MNHPVVLIQRVVRTLQSCKTLEQLVCAERYARLITKAYSKCGRSNDRFDSWNQAIKAEELKMELNQLIKQQRLIIENKC